MTSNLVVDNNLVVDYNLVVDDNMLILKTLLKQTSSDTVAYSPLDSGVIVESGKVPFLFLLFEFSFKFI